MPKQREFLNKVLDPLGPQYVGYYGGFGSGKSVVLCSAIITQAVLYGGEYLISRHFMPELRRTTMKTFLEMCPKELILEVRVADAEVHMKSREGKAIVYFIGLDEPGKIDSMNLSGFAIDEASQTTEEAFLKLQGRLRNPKGLRKGLIVGNPKGRDHVYRYFVSKLALRAQPPSKKYPRGRSVEDVRNDYQMIVAPSTENVHLPEGYVEGMLATYSKERVQRDIYGSFDSFEGMIYNEFDRSKHVIEPFDIPDDWLRVIGQDHGFTNPAASVFMAVDYDNNLYVYDEIYKSETLIQDLCKNYIVPKVFRGGKWDKISKMLIDPSTKAKRNQAHGKVYSDFSVYMENLPKQIPLVTANNEVSTGIDRIKNFLKVDPKTGRPKMFIFSNCVNLIEEIGEYRWAELSASQEGSKNQKEEPRKYNDHLMDAWRYAVMSRPDPKKQVKLPNTFPTMETMVQRELADIRKPKERDPWNDY